MKIDKSTANEPSRELLRALPSVDKLLSCSDLSPLLQHYQHTYIADTVRSVLKAARQEILAGLLTEGLGESTLAQRVLQQLADTGQSPLRSVINATGTVLHTNLGRALLAQSAVDEVIRAATTPVTLEYDLTAAGRGDRDAIIEADLLALTGAEAATVVNNNAAAVLLVLNTVAEGKEGIVSRGELIEIGGAFRIPEVMRKSGVTLREVGTTNRTHARDYAEAMSPETGILLKVHPSNYRIIGFSSEVPLEEIVTLGREHNIPVMEDLGAGALIDLSQYGLPREPIVAERVVAGADIVTFSGDKLLGGPQAGLIVGRQEWIDRIKRNPLKRALRPDKLTLAALSATLHLYRQSPNIAGKIPTLRWLTRPIAEMDAIASRAIPLLQQHLEHLDDGFSLTLEDAHAQIGSGALPDEALPSRVIVIRHKELSTEKIASLFRKADTPILGRIRDGAFLLDLRGVFSPEELIPQVANNPR